MLGGMDSATSGTIMLDGARVSSFNRKQLTQYRRHDIGFVFQFYNLVQNLTARENVELASQICRDPLDADEVLAAGGAGRPGAQLPRTAVRRRAAARGHRPRPGEEPQAPSVRRAHRRFGLRDGQGHPEAFAGHLPRYGARRSCVVTHNSAFTAIADRVIHVREGSVAAVELNETPLSADVLEW